ncbi:putative intracellular protease, PfpI family protein [Oceaniovalibus guishaninsula JLT2003]|uniref:Putative intracellular protease, PfpI family protein n=1 Tax=Oceaniovalibus guishaninsula JLT2003 TaxID=1231392 RepID=K2HS01_9RHOB|nr:type 1 glutamine amidotransferase domain-containing protein [Oceaniovalibus guishaninsula]EKE45494.1 putative intracellular protease, PfpI family protein [Oceaniovalibus guishaninsula JLT2003]
MTKITDARILIMATDGFEQSELLVPLKTLRDKGATVHVASPGGDAIKGWDQDHWGDTVEADKNVADVRADDYDAIMLPGGQINPDILRTKPEAITLIKAFASAGKTVAAICHAPWLLIEADLVRGRTMTCYTSIRTDLRNAGADVVDRSVVQDGNFITSRNPGDLDDFCNAIVSAVEGSRDAAA